MPYIGNTIRAADDYRLIDDISSGFNGSETSFALQVAGSAPVPFPKSPQQVLISVNGVIQEPDPTGASGFNLVGTNIVFSSAPTNGHAFFGIIYATADYLNAGGNFPAGSLGAPSITFIGDENTGLYRKGSGSVGFVSDATEIANFDSNGITISSGNLIIPDSIIHNGDSNTKIRFSGADTVSVETAGTQRLEVASDGKINFGSVARVEADGVFKAAHGDASTPSYNFLNDNDNGMFRVTTNTIGFSTAGTDRLHVDSSGNLTFSMEASSNYPTQQIKWSNDSTTTNGFYIAQHSDRLGRIWHEQGLSIVFGTTNTERMRIHHDGNVGIGTTSPSNRLHIVDSTADIIRAESTSAGGTGANILLYHNSASPADDDVVGVVNFRGNDSGGNQTTYAEIRSIAADVTNGTEDGILSFHNRIAGSFGERMRLDHFGNMLIGKTGTAFTEDGIRADGTGLITLSRSSTSTVGGTANGGCLSLCNPSATDNNFSNVGFYKADGLVTSQINGITTSQSSRHGALAFLVHNGSSMPEMMRITKDGRVAIGTTSPDQLLHISAASNPLIRIENTDTSLSADQLIGGLEFEKQDPSGAGIGVVGGLRMYSGVDGITSYLTLSTSNSSTNNEEHIRIASDGKVGIGTTSPNTLLHLSSADPRIKLTDTDGPLDVTLINSSGDCVFDTPSVHRDVILTSVGQANEIARFTGDGKVGIGTSSPSSIVDISALSGDTILELNRSNSNTTGNVGVINFTASDGHSVGSIGMSGDGDNEGGNIIFRTTSAAADNDPFNAATPEVMRLTSDGSLGIGTGSNPVFAKLNVKDQGGGNGGLSQVVKISNDSSGSGTGAQMNLGAGGGNSSTSAAIAGFYDGTGTTLSLLTSDSFSSNAAVERLRITHGGKLLFGTTDGNGLGSQFVINSSTDDVFGIRFPTENQSGLSMVIRGFVSGTPSGTCSFIQFQRNDGGVRGSITANTNVGVAFNTTSDYRLKENIVSISDGITRLKTLKPSRFNWKEDTGTTVDGFIAHEVTAVPEAVTGIKDEVDENNKPVYQSIDQSKLVPLLTAALQEAIAKIETLETKVAALEAA